MGSSFQPHYWMNFLLISVFIFIPHAYGCFGSIFSFGDSLADTGNLYISSHDKHFHFFFPPYGETYFHHLGRCSDGRLVIDFIAQSLGLPLVRPYLESKNNGSIQNFEGGVNFAVAGATAIDAAFLESMGDSNPYTNNSLRTQLDWFKEILPYFCNTSSNCNEFLSGSLILMGEIGGNDYNDALLGGKSIEQITTYVALVIKEIGSSINELIELGATTILVPGNLPIGCLPIYLTKFESLNQSLYDPSTGCLNWLNKFIEYHNEQLQTELRRIQSLHPHVNIIYADYYNAMMHLYHSPEQFGFIGGTLKACCGGGGAYNYNSSAQCGTPHASACENPAEFINWDGIHFTEAAYRWLANTLLKGKYIIPHISFLCVLEL